MSNFQQPTQLFRSHSFAMTLEDVFLRMIASVYLVTKSVTTNMCWCSLMHFGSGLTRSIPSFLKGTFVIGKVASRLQKCGLDALI